MKPGILLMPGILAVLVISGCSLSPGDSEYISPVCYGAGAYIEGGSYNPEAQTLTITIFNSGEIPLTFNGSVQYRNNTLVNYKDSVRIEPKSTANLTMERVTKDLSYAAVKSEECPKLQDKIFYFNIEGIGEY
jgi:hypothetical protein